jgi:hypothetical protein
MIRSIIIIFALLCRIDVSQVQTPEAVEHGKMLTIITHDFKVDQKQAEIIVSAIQYNRIRILKILMNKSMPIAEKRLKLSPLMAERQEKIKAMLTIEQQRRLKELEMQQKVNQLGPHP